MPFQSEKQKRFFEAVAHGMKPRSLHAPSQAVAQKFVNDSKRKQIAQALGK